jgi:hypothetical protein
MNWLAPRVEENILPTDSVLDLCSGIGTVMMGVKCRTLVAVEIHRPYLKHFLEHYPYSPLVAVNADVREIGELFLHGSFDVVTNIDGVEHLDHDDAIRLLNQMELIARRKVIVFTTDGYVKNEPEKTWGIEGGDDYQRHRSGLTAKDYEKRGYEVRRFGPYTCDYQKEQFWVIFCVKEIK